MSHEPVQTHRKAARGSDRSFGLLFGCVFTVIAVWPYIRHGLAMRLWPLPIALVFFAIAAIRPIWLAPLNRLWFRLAVALNKIVAPVIIGILFFAVVSPYAILLRMRGKDLLRLKRSQDESYWIVRDPPGPAPGTMSKQF